VEWRRASNDGVEIAYGVAGAGPPVLLLHGWPDTSALWREVSSRLVEAGHTVVTPDLRGCGRSDKPTDTASYAMRHLVGDVVAVLDDLGTAPVALVGHDWGANLAWVSAIAAPERFSHLAALSVGHPTAFRSAGLDQQMRSWYTLLFFHEGVGEKFLRRHDYEAMRHWMGHPDVEAVIAELERDGQMSAHLRWYRANLPPDAFVTDPPTLAPVTVPTLGVWSSGDRALTEHQMTDSAQYCVNGFRYVRIERAGHWLPLDVPDELTRELVKFFHDAPATL